MSARVATTSPNNTIVVAAMTGFTATLICGETMHAA